VAARSEVDRDETVTGGLPLGLAVHQEFHNTPSRHPTVEPPVYLRPPPHG
jgi:hypothetical protein